MAVEPSTAARTCYRHPDRETGLRCTRCERSACHECLRPAPVGSHCLACLADGQKSMRLVDAPWAGARDAGPGVALIIAACVGVFLLQLVGVGPGAGLTTRYAMVGALVANGETYRLVTSIFLHFGVMHLAMNMLATWIYGLEVERRDGPVRTVAAFLVAGIVGAAAAFLFQSPFVQGAGASGGVFGLLGIALVRTIRSGQSAQSLVGLLVINLVISIAVPGISLAAHVGGFVAGVVYGLASSAPAKARPAILGAIALAVLAAAAFAVVTSLDPGSYSTLNR